MTYYLGIVDPAEDGTWGIIFPDLKGCYSAGKNMDDLFANSIEAIRLWAEDAVADDEPLPTPRHHTDFMRDNKIVDALKAAGPLGCIIQVPLVLEAGRTVRANLSIDASLLEAIDAAADQRKLTRSAFLASAARMKIESGK